MYLLNIFSANESWLRLNPDRHNSNSRFSATAKYFPARPEHQGVHYCKTCEYLRLLVEDKHVYLQNSSNGWTCSGGITDKLLFSKSHVEFDHRPQWSLKDAQPDPAIYLMSREYNTQCPFDIRNMFVPADSGSKFSDITQVLDDHENLPKCFNATQCPTSITVDGEEFVEHDGVFTTTTSSTKIYRQCTRWVVDKENTISYISFSTEPDKELCLYNLRSVGNAYCAKDLYIGSKILSYNAKLHKYQGERLSMTPVAAGWEMTVDGKVTKTVKGSNSDGFSCPNDFKWELSKGAAAYPIPVPKLYQSRYSECPDTCLLPIRTDIIPLEKLENGIGYNFDNFRSTVDVVHNASNWTLRINNESMSSSSLDAVCPHDVPVWFNVENDIFGNSEYPASARCQQKNWQLQNSRFGYIEEATSCTTLSVFVSNRYLPMEKLQGENTWNVTTNGINYQLKRTMITLDNSKYNYWAVLNTATNFIVAFSRDFTQFPHEVKNWYLLCNNNDCNSGGLFGQDVTYHAQHDNLPKCESITENTPYLMIGAYTSLAVGLVVGAILIQYIRQKDKGKLKKFKETTPEGSPECYQKLLPKIYFDPSQECDRFFSIHIVYKSNKKNCFGFLFEL